MIRGSYFTPFILHIGKIPHIMVKDMIQNLLYITLYCNKCPLAQWLERHISDMISINAVEAAGSNPARAKFLKTDFIFKKQYDLKVPKKSISVIGYAFPWKRAVFI